MLAPALLNISINDLEDDQSVLIASLLLTQNYEKQLICQMIILLLRGNLVG